MKKLLIAALVLVMAVSLSVVAAAPVSAAGPPTIDGVVGAGEWDGATVIDVASGMGTVSVLAHTDYLYVLVDVLDSTDARIGENIHGNDQTSININPTPGAPWGMPCDIIFQMGADPAAWGGTSSGTTDGWETDWEIAGVQQMSLPGDLETMTLYDYGTGTRISEWKIPLASIAPSPGDTLKVAGAIDVGDGSSYCYPVGLDWGDVATYVDILVQQPTSTVGVTANMSQLVSISVDPTSIDYGKILPCYTQDDTLTVTNNGTVWVVVTHEVIGDALFTDHLTVSPGSRTIVTGGSNTFTAHLEVPCSYNAQGAETGTIIFWAEATP